MVICQVLHHNFSQPNFLDLQDPFGQQTKITLLIQISPAQRKN
jgi:hypothetical protein